MNTKTKRIILAAADCYGQGENPYSEQWREDNYISEDDLLLLSSIISTLLSAYALSPRWIQTGIIAAGNFAERLVEKT